jgi:ADP-ribosylglycohydrolase
MIMQKKAWQIDREIRLNTVPLDRRIHDSNWFDADFKVPYGDDLINMFWESKVPGSGAPEIPYLEMVQAMGNKGYDVSEAESLLPEGLDCFRKGDKEALRVITAKILAALNNAPMDPESDYHRYEHPVQWEDVRNAMGDVSEDRDPDALENLTEKIHAGWIGQLAGGSFGTAIEGYTGERIKEVYGEVDYYVTEPETVNDDVVCELVLLDVFEKKHREMTSIDLGWEWVRQITFAWSAEWVALRNLNQGIIPPESGSFQNPFSDWIGVQMRGMICGMLAPGWPIEAARLGHIDGVVSHSANGVYGGMYAAVLTALAFVRNDPREMIKEALNYVPQASEYAAIVRDCIKIFEVNADPQIAWNTIDKKLERYNWIHAYPNIAADTLALWYGEGDITGSFALLALAGMDVDCNGGLVGNILGVMNGVPEKWANPIGDRLETYIKGKEVLSIRALSEKTAKLVQETW